MVFHERAHTRCSMCYRAHGVPNSVSCASFYAFLCVAARQNKQRMCVLLPALPAVHALCLPLWEGGAGNTTGVRTFLFPVALWRITHPMDKRKARISPAVVCFWFTRIRAVFFSRCLCLMNNLHTRIRVRTPRTHNKFCRRNTSPRRAAIVIMLAHRARICSAPVLCLHLLKTRRHLSFYGDIFCTGNILSVF